MKWLIVVIFYTLQGDVYIFTDPTFDSREECVASLQDPAMVPVYTQKLVMEYGRLLPIQGLNCLQEDKIKEILDGVESEKT